MRTPQRGPSPLKCPVELGDVDLFSRGAQEYWYDAYPILHREAPVMKLEGEGLTPGTDGYLLSKYEDIARVVRDPTRYPAVMMLALDKIDENADPDHENYINAMMVSIKTLRPNNELWRAHRQELTDPWVGPGASRHKDMITKHAVSLIDQWIDRGECNFVKEFARPLPQMVMATVLGFPLEDIPQLAIWGNAQVMQFVYGEGHRNILTPEQQKEQAEILEGFKDYVAEKVIEKRKNPQDDMISFLTQVEYSALNRKLTDVEINGIVYAMVIGGLETTQYALEEQAQILCENPDIFAQIKADRSKLRHFTEESMRLRSPTQGLSTRITTQEEEFQGVKVPAGSLLHMRWAAGNLDADEFECPYDMDLERKGVGRHLAFSQGPRVCPGAGISRVEQVTAWELLLDRIDSIEYADGNTFEHQPGIMLGTLDLHVKFTKAA